MARLLTNQKNVAIECNLKALHLLKCSDEFLEIENCLMMFIAMKAY